jgi:hypothetical protein
MNAPLSQVLLLLGGVVLPLGYASLCVWMFRRRVWWFAYIAYFFLFGAVGGWCLTLLFPNGPILLVGVFSLYSAAVLACLVSSLVLQFRKGKSRFEVVAMFGGYCYLAVLAIMFVTTFFVL